jgi:hypothetical protein
MHHAGIGGAGWRAASVCGGRGAITATRNPASARLRAMT